MTLKEAVGVRVDVDIKTGQKLSHSEVYGRIIDFLGGLEAVAPYIPFEILYLREKLKRDPWFNNTDMSKWDDATGFRCSFGGGFYVSGGLFDLYRKHGITSVSCAEGVCILKEAARRLCEQPEIKTIEGLV